MTATVRWKSLEDYEWYDVPQDCVQMIHCECSVCEVVTEWIYGPGMYSHLEYGPMEYAGTFRDEHLLCDPNDEIDIVSGTIVTDGQV